MGIPHTYISFNGEHDDHPLEWGSPIFDDVSLLKNWRDSRVDWQKMVGSAEVHSFSSLTAVSSDHRWIILYILEPWVGFFGDSSAKPGGFRPVGGHYQSSSSRHG